MLGGCSSSWAVRVEADEVEQRITSLKTSVADLYEDARCDRLSINALGARLAAVEKFLVLQEAQAEREAAELQAEREAAAVQQAQKKQKKKTPLKVRFNPQVQTDDAGLPDDEVEYNLGRTLWDAAAILGLPELGLGTSAVLVVSMLTSIAAQAYICWVLASGTSFIKPDLFKAVLQAAERWRHNEAHESGAVDASGVSLASRVCAQDRALSVASTQVTTLSEIDAYLGLDPRQLKTDGWGHGPMLCAVCVFLFAVLVLRELRSLLEFLRAMGALPRGRTRLERGRLVAMSWSRFAGMLSLGFLRAIVALALLCAGVLWLSSTSSLTDLIMSAAALGFVLDLDGHLLETTVPAAVQKVLGGLQPLRYRRLPCCMEAVAPLLCLAGTVTACLMVIVLPLADNMLLAKAMFCDGSLDFAVAQNPAGAPISRATAVFEQAYVVPGMKARAVTELIHHTPGAVLQFSSFAASRQAFAADSEMTILELSRSMPCADVDRSPHAVMLTEAPYWLMAVREETGLHRGLPTTQKAFACRDYAGHCDASAILRAVCPVTCGCADARSGLALSQPQRGCPETCSRAAWQALVNESCSDLDVGGTASWTRYWRSYQQTMSAQLPQRGELFERFADDRIAGGCAGMLPDPLWRNDFCNEDAPPLVKSGLGAIRGFCPGYCCSGTTCSHKCPKACRE